MGIPFLLLGRSSFYRLGYTQLIAGQVGKKNIGSTRRLLALGTEINTHRAEQSKYMMLDSKMPTRLVGVGRLAVCSALK